MSFSPLLEKLIEAFRCLPGVGPKSAQRMTFHLLQKDRLGAKKLANTLLEAVENIGHCKRCRTLCENEICLICANPRRENTKICIVESPADVQAIEQSTNYRGLYFVLMGHLSPIDGIGPGEIGVDLLVERIKDNDIEEVILATNPTIEGEATSHFISEVVQQYNVKTTRIAHGVPIGSELEYTDSSTLSHAFDGRREVS